MGKNRMRVLVVVAALAAIAGAMVVTEDDLVIGKVTLMDKDIRLKEKVIMKLLNHILQTTVYTDIRDVARDFKLEDHMASFLKLDVVKDFIKTYNLGMMPRGEIFTITNELQMREVIKVFHVLYFAKDFDTFIRTACWMRERINGGMFVYALTVAVMHRADCRGIILPAPYEIYPYYFVDSDVIQKAYLTKMKRGPLDKALLDYYGIKVTDKNMVLIDMRKDFRTVLTQEDHLKYFTEDIDLNTYYYYFHMEYPMWMGDDIFGVNKDRRGELYYYVHEQLLARYRLERLSHEMCDIKMLNWDLPLKTGYWPKIRLHTGYDMPVRMNDRHIINEDNTHIKRMVDDYERRIRDAMMNGFIILRDGTRIDLKKSEDIEMLGRLVHGNLDKVDVKFCKYLMIFMKTMLGTTLYNVDKHMYIPTVLDQYETALRDPVFWKLQKRMVDNFIVFKKLLPSYTHDELDFPGVKIDSIETDKLVTYFDDYDMDITNSVFLDESEKKKERSDFVFFARQRRLNHKNFKMTFHVVSDKTTDAVVRIFIGPKYDCMGKLLKINDKRFDMVEIDAFLHKLETGKTTIVRDSIDMHNVIEDRMWTRKIWDKKLMKDVMNLDVDYDATKLHDNFWYRARLGFPKRLLLPKGHRGGLEMQLFVMVTPVNVGKVHTIVDKDAMKERRVCRSTVCFDTLPLGFPFDRVIDVTKFYTDNMRFIDILIFHEDMDRMNAVKGHIDTADTIHKHDDLYMERDYHLTDSHLMMGSSEEMRM